MKSLLFAAAAILIATPAIAHPRSPRGNYKYHYPESNVMVRNDRQRCKKIIYTTKYDQWGWFTRRTIQPLRSCWKHNNNRRHHHHPTVNPQLKIIIK
ncbi:MAG: hypothetical protein CMD32_07810 [Flavobacteriales bacterium]|jgi:hypothetical protein|nr:hypothetical protein [Flavobacteriales bacterium]